jgi:hypothetical protein
MDRRTEIEVTAAGTASQFMEEWPGMGNRRIGGNAIC